MPYSVRTAQEQTGALRVDRGAHGVTRPTCEASAPIHEIRGLPFEKIILLLLADRHIEFFHHGQHVLPDLAFFAHCLIAQ